MRYHEFIYDGTSSIEFGAYIWGSNSEFNSPERSYDKLSVAGKNGDLVFDNGRYENVPMVYSVVIPDHARPNLDAFRAFLQSKTGYHRLEDTIHGDEYYMAMVDGGIEPTLTSDFGMGKFKVKFSRMPQRFLKSGEETTEYSFANTNRIEITNPTRMDAKPLIRVYGWGNLYINGVRITIRQHTMAYIDIDFETEDAYISNINMNGYIELASYMDFPSFKSGNNIITTTDSTISKIFVTPRWWTL